ncbi:MAG: GAF domain-containing protein [Burkholderiales bacterium]|nr:GAF domain-containing protein [Burkholderiales bacterium]
MSAVQTDKQTSPPQARASDPLGNVGYYGRLLAPALTRPVAVVEVICVMALAIGCSYLLRPADPLMVHIGFPWLWLVAAVMALRYGALLGVLAGICITAAWYGFYGHAAGAEFPAMFFVGGLALVVISGHFCDIWGNRANRISSINTYLSDRLVAITNNHYLLRISHDRLEHDVLTRPVTMRDAIMRLRDFSPAQGGAAPDTPLPNVQGMLEFAALTCQIGDASIFPVTRERVEHVAAASVGEPFEVDSDDPLLRDCLEKNALSHLRELDETGRSAYLVCAPLIAASGKLIGVLVVRRMAFLSLNQDNLQLLLVLLGYYADSVEHRAMVDAITRRVPDCPYDFALELARLTHMKRASNIDSALVALVFARGTDGDSLFDQVTRTRRALDVLWAVRDAERQMAITLMPLTDDNGINGYLMRTENTLKSQFSTDFEKSRVAVHTVAVSSSDPGDVLQGLLQRCGHHG